MTAYVSLLRGVNLGPTTQLAMADLKQLYVDVGFEAVATYIRSGNVVFASPDRPGPVRERIEAAIAERFAMDVGVVVRDAAAMAGVLGRNPFPDADPARLAVVFLSAAPPHAVLADLGRADFGDDAYVADGAEIFLHLPNGFGRSTLATRMSALRDPVLGTVRNWRTVGRLAQMLSEVPVDT